LDKRLVCRRKIENFSVAYFFIFTFCPILYGREKLSREEKKVALLINKNSILYEENYILWSNIEKLEFKRESILLLAKEDNKYENEIIEIKTNALDIDMEFIKLKNILENFILKAEMASVEIKMLLSLK